MPRPSSAWISTRCGSKASHSASRSVTLPRRSWNCGHTAADKSSPSRLVFSVIGRCCGLFPCRDWVCPAATSPLWIPIKTSRRGSIEKLFMGHLFDGTRDPEGILSTIPAIATTLLGVLTGHWLRSRKSPRNKSASHAARRNPGFGRRQSVEHLVSLQQESLDQLVRGFQRAVSRWYFSPFCTGCSKSSGGAVRGPLPFSFLE